jgi:hypothetical protein
MLKVDKLVLVGGNKKHLKQNLIVKDEQIPLTYSGGNTNDI